MNDILNEEKEYNNIYAIPANYTDSGKILGGMLELRNAVETVLIVGAVGYPELTYIHTYIQNNCPLFNISKKTGVSHVAVSTVGYAFLCSKR